MSIANFLNYEASIELQDRQLEIWGQPATIFSPENRTALGYEDTTYDQVENLDSDKVLGNIYHKYQTRLWINFTISKSTFYKHNWFPTDSEELCMAILKSDSPAKEGDYIRTAIPGCTSIWGDMIFEVRKIIDIGLAQVLRREYYLKATNNADLYKELSF